MSSELAKENLKALIMNPDAAKVVVLSGLWGTGKTHMWRSIETECGLKDPKPIYFSLFGVRNAEDLKLKILESILNNKDAKYKELVDNGVELAKAAVSKFLPGVSAGKLAFLGMRSVLKDRLIVIDDIERKHDALDVQEVMGFINECSEQHSSRFLLLLNAEKLNGISTWKAFNERVVDREIKLAITPSEAFAVALGNKELSAHSLLAKECESLGLVNIRIIRRVIDLYADVLDGREYDPVGMVGFIPAIVFSIAVHYSAIDDLPPFDFLIKHGSLSWALKKEKPPQEQIWVDRISMVSQMNKELLPVLNGYFDKGYLDRESLERVINLYKSKSDRSKWMREVMEFQKEYLWDKNFEVSYLERKVETYKVCASYLSGVEVTQIVSICNECNKADLGSSLLSEWIRVREPNVSDSEIEFEFGSRFDNLHSEIIEMYARAKSRLYPNFRIEDAVEIMASALSWNQREIDSFNAAKEADFESALERLNGERLGGFISDMFKLSRIRSFDEGHPNTIRYFYSACRNKYQSAPESRLALIIYREFQANGVGEELEYKD